MLWQCRVTECNKCMVLGQDVDRGGGCVCEQKEYIGTLLSVQHCCEPTTARKIKFINK